MARIALIDRDIEFCKLFERLLIRKGYDVFYANNYEKLLAFISQNKVDVLFCEYEHPDNSEGEMCKRIKKMQPSVETVIITAEPEVRVAVKVIKNGAVDYLVKPLLPNELLQRVEMALIVQKEKSVKKEYEPFANGKELFNKNSTADISEPIQADLRTIALNAECAKIQEVLRTVNYNKSKAALLLNIDRKTLYNKMKNFNM